MKRAPSPRTPSSRARASRDPKRIAMFAFPDVQVLDVTGPLEVFSRASRWLRDSGKRADHAYQVEIIGLRKDKIETTITGLEMFQKTLEKAIAGDNVGALLRGIERTGIERGQVIAKPGSITPHTRFEGNIYVLSKEEGGRHTPFFSKYKPQFYFRTTDVTGSITLPEGVEMCMPGDNVKITVELMEGMPVAMDEGLRFAIREGGRTVGSGVVTKILQ